MEAVMVVMVTVVMASWTGLSLECPRNRDTGANSTTLNIISLFAMTGDYSAGKSYLPAALLAVKHINDMPNILPRYRLQINAHDTMVGMSYISLFFPLSP